MMPTLSTSLLLLTSTLLLRLTSCKPASPHHKILETRQGRPISTWRPWYPSYDPDHTLCNNITQGDINAWAASPLQSAHAPAPTTGGIPIPTYTIPPSVPPAAQPSLVLNPSNAASPPAPTSATNVATQRRQAPQQPAAACQLLTWMTYTTPPTGALEVNSYDMNTQTVALPPGTYTLTWDTLPGGLASGAFMWEVRAWYASPGKSDYKLGAKFRVDSEAPVGSGMLARGEMTFRVSAGIGGQGVVYMHFETRLGTPRPFGVLALWRAPEGTVLGDGKWVFPPEEKKVGDEGVGYGN